MGFRNPPVAGEDLTLPAIRSQNYVEAVAGWRLSRDGDSQVDSLQVLHAAGVNGPLTADSIAAGPGGLQLADGSDVGARLDALEAFTGSSEGAPLPGQIIAGGTFNTSDTLTASRSTTTETGVMAVDTGVIPSSGFYRLELSGLFHRNNAAGAQSGIRVRYTSTTDGSTPATPTTSSAILGDGPHVGVVVNQLIGVPAHILLTLNAGIRLRLLFTYFCSSGTSTLLIGEPVGVSLTYHGAMATVAVGSGYGKGLSLAAGASSDGTAGTTTPAPTPHTKTYAATWSRSYDGAGATRYDDSAYCYQGFYSSSNGNQRSLIGFDYNTISADLTGASNVTLKLVFKVAHTFEPDSVGMSVYIGGHVYSAKPSSWADANVAQAQIRHDASVAGSSYTVTLPASFVTNFASKTWKGIAIGPGSSLSQSLYGYLFGATQTGHPYLTATYTK